MATCGHTLKSLVLLRTQINCYCVSQVFERNKNCCEDLPHLFAFRDIPYVTTGRRVLLEKLQVPHLVTKFSGSYGSRGFITVFTTARRLSLTSARQI
jgi:hypothetical protein